MFCEHLQFVQGNIKQGPRDRFKGIKTKTKNRIEYAKNITTCPVKAINAH